MDDYLSFEGKSVIIWGEKPHISAARRGAINTNHTPNHYHERRSCNG